MLAEQHAFLRQQQYEGSSDRPRFMFVDRRAAAQLDVCPYECMSAQCDMRGSTKRGTG